MKGENMPGPLKPEQVGLKKIEVFPEAVFDCFNELIAATWNGYESIVKQEDVLDLIKSRLRMARQDILDKHYLDVEDVYREAGWEVQYDRPAYNEQPYPAFFRFKKK
jgi:hypothetical protein